MVMRLQDDPGWEDAAWTRWEREHPFIQALDHLPVAVMLFDTDAQVHYANRAAHELLRGSRSVEASLDDLLTSFQPRLAGTGRPYPPSRMPVLRALAGEKAEVDDIEIDTDDGVALLEVWAAPIVDDEGVVAYAVVGFHDISGRRRNELEKARLLDSATRHSRWLDAVREVLASILANRKPDEVLDLVAWRAQELVDADTSTIGTPLAEDCLVISAARGWRSEQLRGSRVRLDHSPMGEAIKRMQAVRVADAAEDGRPAQPVVQLGMGPSLFIPLVSGGTAFGAICLARQRGRAAFTDEEIRLAQTFADQAAVAVEYGRVQQELSRIAVLEDRERIARDLHDGVIQSLFAVGMGLTGTAAMIDRPEARTRIESAVEELDEVIREVRNYIFSLRSGTPAGRDVAAALRALGRDLEATGGVTTIVDVDELVLAEQAQWAGELIQLLRETLSNVARHAGAQTCRIRVGHEKNEIVLEVEDDGHGFDVEAARHKGDGLRNLEARVAAMGARLQIDSGVGSGTTVRVRMTPGAANSTERADEPRSGTSRS